MNTIVCPKCQHSMSLHGCGTEVLASELGNDFWFKHYAPL